MTKDDQTKEKITKDNQVCIRLTEDEYTVWSAKATEHKCKSLSQFVRNCVMRVIGDENTNPILDMLAEIKKNQDLGPIREELAELKKVMVETQAITIGKERQLARLAREISSPADNELVLSYIQANGESNLDQVEEGTTLPREDAFRALQFLTQMDRLAMDARRRPATWRVI